MADQTPVQATQLKLAFAPSPPSRISVDLAGMTLLVDGDRPDAEMFTYLSSCGLEPEFRPGLGVSIPARLFTSLVKLDVTVIPSETLRPIWLLATNSPDRDLPATVERSGDSYLVSWESTDGVGFDELVHPSVAPLLGFADLPIVATDGVWVALERDLPTLGPSGSASLSIDGFIKITTSKPQILESSKIPGLFRISPTAFGTCLAFADEILAEPGIRWSGPRPPRRAPAVQLPTHIALAPHISTTVHKIAADLTLYGSKAIVWEQGLGRRMLALTALEVLDAYPATVLCPPHAIWLWRRHVESVMRSCGLANDNCDIQVVTYHDVQHRRIEPQALIFDDLSSSEALAAWPSQRRLQHLTDSYRIAIEDAWPDDPHESIRLMEVLRPPEFCVDVPFAERYPVDPTGRLREHVEVYLDRRRRDETADLLRFRRSSVRLVETTPAQESAIAVAASKSATSAPERVLAETLELISVGPSTSLSPKIAAAADLARHAASTSRSVAVLTRHHRAVQLLRSVLRPMSTSVVESPSPFTEVSRVPLAVIRFDTFLPRLDSFDVVIVVDYPWSLTDLDRAVGSAQVSTGPDVIVLHATHSVDDRLAVFAARRSEYGAVDGGSNPPSATEVEYLLTPRRS